jgi:virulence plasmid B protein
MNDRDTRRRTPATADPARRDELVGTLSAQAEPRATGDGTPDPKPQNAAGLHPSVTAPKGGGAIRGLDEKLSLNAATGTCATSVRIPLSLGRSGFTPSLSLTYDSGSGNGPLGFGWSIGLPEITRKTDKGLPRYCHGDESDVFVLTAADDLVPVVNPDGSRETISRVLYGASFEIEFYRPRVEGLFSRIERWTETATGNSHWRTISRDKVTTLYGTDPASQIADPADPDRVRAPAP